MTLHWWMHWFWVTSLLIPLIGQHGLTNALPVDNISTDIHESPSIAPASELLPPATVSERRPKAIQIKPTPTGFSTTQRTVESKLSFESRADRKPPPLPDITPYNSSLSETSPPETASISPVADTTVPPRDNRTRQYDTAASSIDIAASATEPAWSIETTLAELAPLASSGDLVQASLPAGRTDGKEDGGLQAGAIAGISLGALAVVALSGTAGFFLYRRRYLNNPQTLNDKCSNPDSSGYLDDSTIRENSEEMYSLDNDSFLNSLEAMTIQNYWTESVKHSKL